MSRFTLVRGWLECTFDEVADIRSAVERFASGYRAEHVTREQVDLYMKGWMYPEQPINWMSLVFYGADVNSISIPFLIEMIRSAAAAGEEINGLFYVDDEEAQTKVKWEISNCVLRESFR